MNGVTDLVIRIKNGYMSGRETIVATHSKYSESVVKKLMSLGYIKDYEVTGEVVKHINLTLVYRDGVAAFTDVKLFSTSGKRWYVSAKELKPVLGGLGWSILSTPHGILTHVEAKKNKVGGELLFNIW